MSVSSIVPSWKRPFDLLIAIPALILVSPVLCAVAFLVRLRIGSPVFFRQQRPGLAGELFTLHKFRTMTDERGPDGQLLPDDRRITPFGAWLRATSIDELPELWDVIRGRMSLVGPRPLLVEYLQLYTPRQSRRHNARPGITGWAQVNGRNATGWAERLEMDLWYVDNQSILLDLRILGRTLVQVARRADIAQPGNATKEQFRGEE